MKEKLERLQELKMYIESETFQLNIMKPLYAEIDKQKNAFDCESLRELATVKGKTQGLNFLIKRLKEIDNEIKNLRYELK